MINKVEEESKTEEEVDENAEEEKASGKDKKKTQFKNKQQAFKEYKEGDGKAIEEKINESRTDLNAKKKEMERLKDV